MQSSSLTLSVNPPALTQGAVRVEINHLAALIVQHLLEQPAGVPYPKAELKAYLEDKGFDFPAPLELNELLKNFRQAARLVGLDNPILQLGDKLLLNSKVKIYCEADEGPDLLDVIYSDLLKPH